MLHVLDWNETAIYKKMHPLFLDDWKIVCLKACSALVANAALGV